MELIYNSEFNKQALIILKEKLKFSAKEIYCENFNNNFTIYFNNGYIGIAGIVNGPFEIDIYKSYKDMENGANSIKTIFICDVKEPTQELNMDI